jgi:hypothetical protein
VKVKAFSEPVILSGDIEKLAADFFACDACGIDTNPLCFRAEALRLKRQLSMGHGALGKLGSFSLQEPLSSIGDIMPRLGCNLVLYRGSGFGQLAKNRDHIGAFTLDQITRNRFCELLVVHKTATNADRGGSTGARIVIR